MTSERRGWERVRDDRPQRYGQSYQGGARASLDAREHSRSPSPDPELARFLAEQARPGSPDSEAYRKQRIAAGGVSHSKSRHQKEREEGERRKKEAEEDAAKAYEDFLQHMEGRGGDDVKRRKVAGASFVRAGGQAYLSGELGKDSQIRDDGAMISSADDEITIVEPPRGKKGAMQDFLGELQRNQAAREERLKGRISESQSVSSLVAQELQRGHIRDIHDPQSANICLVNLPANLSERRLALYASVHGDVGSVKILWARNEEPRFAVQPSGGVSERHTRNAGATGFVNFMERSDAERAYRAIDGSTWEGCILRASWSKSVPRSPIPICRKRDPLLLSQEESTSQEPAGDAGQTTNLPSFLDEGRSALLGPELDDSEDAKPLKADEDAAVADNIDAMLRGLTLRRERIAYTMFFAIQHASHADIITDRAVQSLLLPTTPLTRKLARLYAVSDILHNSAAAAHGAWRYRSLLAGRLDRVFAHWGDVANSFAGRIKRASCKDPVRSLLDVWTLWMVFDAASIERWRGLLESGSQPSKGVQLEIDAAEHAEAPAAEDDIDGFEMAAGSTEEDIDGFEMAAGSTEEDIDGEDMGLEDGDATEARDGEDDIDGEEM